MISIKCDTKDHVLLADCEPFQGNLKKRSKQDLDALKQSLMTEGLLMPFAIWEHDGKKLLLDGHARRQVLMSMAGSENEPDILAKEWPCIYVQAETEDDARKALLQITSQYGKITKAGYKQFTMSIPTYVAPSVSKFVSVAVKKDVSVPKAQSDKKILKIRVPVEKYEQVLSIFNSFDFIEVL